MRGLEVRGAHQAWLADLTYLRTAEGSLYLSLISDAATRKIIGYEASDRLEVEGCLASLEQALKQRPEGVSHQIKSGRKQQHKEQALNRIQAALQNCLSSARESSLVLRDSGRKNSPVKDFRKSFGPLTGFTFPP